MNKPTRQPTLFPQNHNALCQRLKQMDSGPFATTAEFHRFLLAALESDGDEDELAIVELE